MTRFLDLDPGQIEPAKIILEKLSTDMTNIGHGILLRSCFDPVYNRV